MSLIKACAENNLTEICKIINSPKERFQFFQTDNNRWSCLHHAVANGNVECLKHLLTVKGLDIAAETHEGHTALTLAISLPNVNQEIISVLLEANRVFVGLIND